MLINKLIIILYINLTFQNIIENGVYDIINNNLHLNKVKNNNNIYLSKNFYYPNTFFRITKLNFERNVYFYKIEDLETNSKLSCENNSELVLNNKIDKSELWKIIRINETNYLIENYNHYYLTIEKNKINCKLIPSELATYFQLVKIYSENLKDTGDSLNNKLLKQEPIDVLIKYIDLKDPNLKRNGVHQIEKDYDNEELRYSIRSILLNIPWIRKIFILMPNEKVSYFKDYKYISNKIIYIKDKEILGYESSNSLAFQYRYWKMKKFGISDNIIIMDDDCFIGNKLEKDDFFYVKNGKVFPLIITADISKIYKEPIEKYCEIYQKKARTAKEEQNDDVFQYSKYLTYNFIFNLFNLTKNQSLFIPFYTHNAIPINLKDVKDVFDLVYNSKYKYTTLDCPYRNYEYLHFQILIVTYTFIKYNKEVNHISHKYIQLNKSLSYNYNYSLFCINKGSGNYPLLNLYKAKFIMEYLFPIPSPFEVSGNSLYNLSFDIIFLMDKNEKEYKSKISILRKTAVKSFIMDISVIFIIIIYKLYLFYLYQ